MDPRRVAKIWNHLRPRLIPMQNEKSQGLRGETPGEHSIAGSATSESILGEDGTLVVETVAPITATG